MKLWHRQENTDGRKNAQTPNQKVDSYAELTASGLDIFKIYLSESVRTYASYKTKTYHGHIYIIEHLLIYRNKTVFIHVVFVYCLCTLYK